MIPSEHPRFTSKRTPTIRPNKLRLTNSTWVKEDLPRSWVGGVVFLGDGGLDGGFVAEGDPEAFAGPADVDDFLGVGEEGEEEGRCFWGVF